MYNSWWLYIIHYSVCVATVPDCLTAPAVGDL